MLDDVDAVHRRRSASATLVGIVVLKRIAPKLPGPLVALVVGIVLSTVLDLPAKGVAVVGDVATGIPLPQPPDHPRRRHHLPRHGRVRDRLPGPRRIDRGRPVVRRRGTATTSTRTRSSSRSAPRTSRAGLFGGFAVDASLSQSATGEAAGNRTQLSTLDHGRSRPRHLDRPRAALPQPAAVRARRDRHHVRR